MKGFKKPILFIVILSALTLILAGCGGGGGGGGRTTTLVSITVTPSNPSITAGATQQFTATGTYSDGSTQNITSSVTWNSSNTGVATINSAGLATSVAVGATNITATSGSISGNTTLTVTTSTVTASVNLPKTGQTTSYAIGDDGELQKGVAWPSPRFTVGTGTEVDCVTDNLTGLMWVKAPNTTRTWADAMTYANGLSLCGYDDWRLPNINELESLVHAGKSDTATWLNAQGFSNVQAYWYWSSTTYAYGTGYAWIVHMWRGHVLDGSTGSNFYVWPVRAGQ